MPREFIDSLSFTSESQLESCIHTASQLGFSEIWVSNPTKKVKKRFNNIIESYSIRIYERADIGLKSESKKQITTFLRQQRRNIPIIAVTCLIPEITAWAAQDNRVDILKFPVFQISKLLTRSTAKLMVKFEKHLEIPLSELYCLPEKQQIAAIRQVRMVLKIVQRKQVPILFSSSSSNLTQMRSPRELISLGQILLDIPTLPLDSLSSIPQQLLNQNLVKITPNYISPGIFRIGNQIIKNLNQLQEEE